MITVENIFYKWIDKSNETEIKSILKIFAELIQYVSKIRNDNWNTSYRKSNTAIQLNCGNKYVLRYKDRKLLVMCDRSEALKLDSDFIKELLNDKSCEFYKEDSVRKNLGDFIPRTYNDLKSISANDLWNGSYQFLISTSAIEKYVQPLIPAIKAFGKWCIENSTIYPQSKEAHEKDFIDYINEKLKMNLKQPKYLESHEFEWQHLLSAYKKLLKEHQNVAFDDEEYKWETITYSVGKSWKEILLYLLGKTESSKKASNLFYYSALSNAKVFLDDSRLDSVMNSLSSESEDLDIRFDKFKSDINELTSNLAENYARPDDERSASVFLTCRNPQKYTFYKPSYYEKLCDCLKIKTEPAGKKYSHYLNLISDFETHVKADSEIMDFYNSHTAQYEKSTKLIAQNIIYTLFESGAKFVNLNGEPDMKNSLAQTLAELLLHTHNLILHGAPGTGKTHLAHEIAKYLNAETQMVQFHPSYDYTDFVEGLRPVNDSNASGGIGFERRDGVFKEFCKNALQNLIDSKKSVEDLQKQKNIDEQIEDFLEKAIDDEMEFEIAHGNKFKIEDSSDKSILISIPANKITNELSLPKNDLVQLLNSNTKIESGADIKSFFNRKLRTQQDSYILTLYNEVKSQKQNIKVQNVQKVEKRNFLFIIDEINRGELSKIFGELFYAIESGYRGEKGRIQTQYQNLVEDGDVFKDGFFVPENVYIIGTMNDIDRSVDTMDFAFRRRFTFKEIKAEDTIEMLDEKAEENGNKTGLPQELADEAKIRMKNLNNAISAIEGLNSSYHIGGAYFLKLNELGDDFDALWNYHLSGLLREYLRGRDDAESKLTELKNAYDNASHSELDSESVENGK